MRIRYKLLLITYISMISCSLQSNQMTDREKMSQAVMLEFEEISHVNVKLIDSEYQLLNSQADINKIYKTINENNPSPRKSPIPPYEGDPYIVLQPQITKTDFEVKTVSQSGKSLRIHIQETDNPEFKNKKHPASIIILNKKITYNKVEIKTDK